MKQTEIYQGKEKTNKFSVEDQSIDLPHLSTILTKNNTKFRWKGLLVPLCNRGTVSKEKHSVQPSI